MNTGKQWEIDRIDEIADELTRLARRLRGRQVHLEKNIPVSAALGALSSRLPHFAAMAKAEYAARRNRSNFFDPALLGEPAWDILLDLFIHQISGKRVAVTSACIAASVPPTTALRWIAILEERKLVVREADLFDGRRSYLRLTDNCLAKFVRHFEHADRQQVATTMSSFESDLIDRGESV